MMQVLCSSCKRPLEPASPLHPRLCNTCSRAGAAREQGRAFFEARRFAMTGRDFADEASKAQTEMQRLRWEANNLAAEIGKKVQALRGLEAQTTHLEVEAALRQEAWRLARERNTAWPRPERFPGPGKNGFYLALEGIDGSGKSRLARALQSLLPYSRVIAETWAPGRPVPPEQIEAALTMQREEHLEREVLPELEQGRTVIADRCYLSTAAYQGTDSDWQRLLEQQARRFRQPDLVLILTLPVETALARIRAERTPDAFERTEILEKAQDRYREMAGMLPRAIEIQADRNPEDLLQAAMAHLPESIRNPEPQRSPA